ncbi:MAG: thioesterase family protein [Anaerolineae bacterium]
MFENLKPGLSAERTLVVAHEHTASSWGSGALEVYSTPHMIAMMEGAAVDAVDPLLPEGYQTVGTHLDVRHLAATPVGRRVTARAELVAVHERTLTFRVEAFDEDGELGEGRHERFVINVARFMERTRARGK